MGIGGTRIGRSTVAEVDLAACARNFRRLRDHVGGRDVWAVVKAGAYGHGAVRVARRLALEGVAGFAVATVGEGVELRRASIRQPLLVMAGIEPVTLGAMTAVVEHRLAVAVWDAVTAERIGAVALKSNRPPVRVHLKVDTGMGRLGVVLERAQQVAAAVGGADGIRLDGLFSNLAAADQQAGEGGHAHTTAQVRRFAGLCETLRESGNLPRHRHLANSAALLHHPGSWKASWCTGVRPGLALYGASLTRGRDPLVLEPVLSLRTAVAAVRDLPGGYPVGYGLRHVTSGPSRIAALPVGYHDGWPRALSDSAQVLVGDRRVPVVGAISMDLTLVDVTAIPQVSVGDAAVLIGPWSRCPPSSGPVAGVAAASGGAAMERMAISVEEVAAWAHSIPHELLCRIGVRVPRRYLDGNASGIIDRGAEESA
ncbi:MAG: alanine racemase [Acidobacteriota bacterium]